MKTIFDQAHGRLAKSQIVQLLDNICLAIEPTEEQYKQATERYDTISQFLAAEDSPLQPFEPAVYPQGSMRSKTAIRPAHGKEFDVDLVCEFKRMPHPDPKEVKRFLWDRFRTSDRYKNMVKEKNRCIQIQYAGDFHMDVMPCVPGQPGWAKVGSVWVPDKKLDDWKPSNPIGFAIFVEKIAAKSPRQIIALANRATEARAGDIEPLDAQPTFTKPALIRIIQILKRHRDQFFTGNPDKAPISVILTTLAAHSYNNVIERNTYETVYDLLLDVVGGMPRFIKVNQDAECWVENPSHPEENFAEKWNSDRSLENWFHSWHRATMAGIKQLDEQEEEGLDSVGVALENSFGRSAANKAVKAFSASIRDNTARRSMGVTSAGMVAPLASGIHIATKTPPHTNHGS